MKETPRLLLIILLTLVCLAGSAAADDDRWTLSSPDGTLTLTVVLGQLPGGAADAAGQDRLYYTIDHGRGDAQCQVIGPSPLGITRDDQSFVDALQFVAAGRVLTIDESYQLVHGKRRECRVHAHRQVLTFQNAQGARVQLELHVADGGAAFRYGFPEEDDTQRTVTGEATGFRVPDGAVAWIQPYQEPSKWTPAYEDYFGHEVPAGQSAPSESGWCFPALFHTPATGRWVLLTEAAVDRSYCGTRLAQHAPENVYQIRFPQPGEGNGVGDVCPRWTLPWKTPWRALVIADSPAGIVESTLVTDLNPPCAVADTSWIHPARVSWSWWSDHDSPRDFEKLRVFVDLAAEMGWEYSLVDANWTLMDKGNVRELARYAADQGVGLLLWYNSGGEHNIVTEKPRGCLAEPEVRRFEFELLKQWGIKGVKVDFFQSDKQHMMQLYQGILEDAADQQLMVNFHGCTLPRGWSRTYPHLMSMESVRGAECYTFAKEYPEKAPWHNTILPFTRNVVGPMDYTPVAFSNGGYARQTTMGHELALAVVFESGWLHFADRVSAYQSLPDVPREMLKQLPAAWDDTRLVAGYPGKSVVMARRLGDVWYLAGINGQDQACDVPLDLSFLDAGRYRVTWVEDGSNDTLADRQTVISAAEAPSIALPPRGGFLARMTPAD
jgi:hypothetical protein